MGALVIAAAEYLSSALDTPNVALTRSFLAASPKGRGENSLANVTSQTSTRS
jgi:hypothetical protein